MNRRSLLNSFLALSSFACACPVMEAQGKGKGHHRDDDDQDRGQDSRYFRREDDAVVQRYYNGPRNLPPGLRKKYRRTGKLPPGWQKKLQPFPPELVRVLPPPPPNCDRGYIDGFAVVYDRRTRIIIDMLDIAGAIAGH